MGWNFKDLRVDELAGATGPKPAGYIGMINMTPVAPVCNFAILSKSLTHASGRETIIKRSNS
jgi:hypothetical protein